ncbi:Protein of unknown function [Pyronema omphalodes CBS 100304]|uniref:Uncharacterized protein n=1 Tax=Pyronema omphalodes (strain CBS 100304) TaxID=1076935 RepID=U4LDI7_PYROM|nr:Protein of unknown function [Pyronema omphalodes CBS 100304]
MDTKRISTSSHLDTLCHASYHHAKIHSKAACPVTAVLVRSKFRETRGTRSGIYPLSSTNCDIAGGGKDREFH